MIDYIIRPIANVTLTPEESTPPYNIIFQCGEQKHTLSYVNGGVHHAYFRSSDRVNGNPLLNALEVILNGLPKTVHKIDVRAESNACREALKRECDRCNEVIIVDRLATPAIVRKVTFHI